MRIYSPIIVAFLSILAIGFLEAANGVDVYDTKTLQKANQTYSEKIRLVWNEDLLGRLTVKEQQAAEGVSLNLPWRGVQRSPFEYYSNPVTREITIAIPSVKFFDDLSIAEAWLTSKECAIDPISDYVGILRYQGSSFSAGNGFPPPLQAFGIPQNALADAFVDDVSGKTLKSAIYFLMAHELAHVIYQHKSYNLIKWAGRTSPRSTRRYFCPEPHAQNIGTSHWNGSFLRCAAGLNLLREISQIDKSMKAL